MAISIVITTYGSEEWRELAWSLAYPSALAQNADEIVVHHEPDRPIGPARNLAANQATGDWLIFLDADDELDPGYVDHMRVSADLQPHTTLFQPSVIYQRKGSRAHPVLLGPKDLRHDNYLVVGTMISRRLFWAVHGFNDYPHGFEDWSLWAKAWKHGAQVVQVPNAVYVAHINPRSKHRQMWRDRKTQVETHLRVQAELFPEGVA